MILKYLCNSSLISSTIPFSIWISSSHLKCIMPKTKFFNACLPPRSLQSCPALCNPMDSSLPGFSVHGILRARIPEWLPFPPPGDLPNPGTEPTAVKSPAGRQVLYHQHQLGSLNFSISPTKSCFAHTLLFQWIATLFFELLMSKALKLSFTLLFLTCLPCKLLTNSVHPPWEIDREPDSFSPLPCSTTVKATIISCLVVAIPVESLPTCFSKIYSQHSSWNDSFLTKPRLFSTQNPPTFSRIFTETFTFHLPSPCPPMGHFSCCSLYL